MLYRQTGNSIKYYTNEDAMVIWNAMMASKAQIYETIRKLEEVEWSF